MEIDIKVLFKEWVKTCELSDVECLIDNNLQGKNQRSFIRLVNAGIKGNAFLFLKCKNDEWLSYEEIHRSAFNRSRKDTITYKDALYLLKIEFMERVWWQMARMLSQDRLRSLPPCLDFKFDIK